MKLRFPPRDVCPWTPHGRGGGGRCSLEAVRCVERIDDPSVIDQGGDRRIGKQETADRRRVVARSRDASPGNGNRAEEEPRPSISVRIHLQLHGPITSSIIIYLTRFQLFYLLNDLCSPSSWLICSYFIFIASYELKIHLKHLCGVDWVCLQWHQCILLFNYVENYIFYYMFDVFDVAIWHNLGCNICFHSYILYKVRLSSTRVSLP